ncbi:MAG TPA: hypothetical protein VFL99_13830 [Segeticoccus sp.]|uniref:hypothetical protein n=1 Tax=Segeticoccus sp. TaxID=2706531 RepID=UPI002D7FC251|nr:hypothetical protein [Segeticoccus sp.]HET8601403.1 hypothetical protein [Segeticoccus sp.]
MNPTRRRAIRWASAVVAVAATVPLTAVATASAASGPPTHRQGHGWTTVHVCDPAGKAPYKYTIDVGPLGSINDQKGYVAFANNTYKYYRFSHGQFTVKDAPAKPVEVGGLHYAKGHNHDPLTATVVSGPKCRR